jgi:hypothetical protein
MSLFDLNDSDMEDIQIWMAGVRDAISQFVDSKQHEYSFNFASAEPIPDGVYEWDNTVELEKRKSTLMRSSVSTVPTLGEEMTEEIPRISDFEFRISQELAASPIMLLPHKR